MVNCNSPNLPAGDIKVEVMVTSDYGGHSANSTQGGIQEKPGVPIKVHSVDVNVERPHLLWQKMDGATFTGGLPLFASVIGENSPFEMNDSAFRSLSWIHLFWGEEFNNNRIECNNLISVSYVWHHSWMMWEWANGACASKLLWVVVVAWIALHKIQSISHVSVICFHITCCHKHVVSLTAFLLLRLNQVQSEHHISTSLINETYQFMFFSSCLANYSC